MVSLSVSHISATHPSLITKNTLMGNASDRDIPPSSTKRVAIVGAGISGLAAAYKLKSNGVSVTLFEADGRAGGKIRTVMKDGLIWDEGANTMTESESEVTSLLDDLGLRDQQQYPIAQNKRYIAKDGLPVLIPSDPIALIKSNILSAQSKFSCPKDPGGGGWFKGKGGRLSVTAFVANLLIAKALLMETYCHDDEQLQILLEPFLWKKRLNKKVFDEEAQESVGDFFDRHFGKEFVDYLIDPFLAGTSAGDPQSLSMRHVFPELWAIENRSGSVIAGAIQSRMASTREQGGKKNSNKKPSKRSSFSFKGGMQTLVDTICNNFSEGELKLRSEVLSLSFGHSGQLKNWSVTCLSNKTLEDQSYDAVVVTAPLSNVKEMKLLTGGNPFSLDFIPEVSYLPLSVIITTFEKANVKRPLEGFGVLIPSKEQQKGLKTLGTLFSSMMFPDRAPSDLYLYTTFVGGSRNRELAKASANELERIVSSDLHQLLGTEGEPQSVNHYYWRNAFPLYGHNYESVLRAIEKMEQDLPGFFYAGNHKDGLSVGKAIASGYKAANSVMSYLDSYSDLKTTD